MIIVQVFSVILLVVGILVIELSVRDRKRKDG